MAEPGALEYFYGTEAEQYTFYRIPKVLFTDPGFKQTTGDAKILYGLMLDRMGLSIRNGWLDEQNRVFIYFTEAGPGTPHQNLCQAHAGPDGRGHGQVRLPHHRRRIL